MPVAARLGLVLLGLTALAGAARALLLSRPLAWPTTSAQPAGRRPAFGEPVAAVLDSARPQEGPGTVLTGPASAMTPPLTETTNILLAGLDTRRDGWSGGRTDSLTVLVLDERTPHLGLVSIPRDLEVLLEGHEPERINAVYAMGAREGGGSAQAGDLVLRRVIRQTLGLPISYSIYIDYAGFETLIDELDGISVRVRCPIRDRFLDPRGPDGRLELRLDAGYRSLDGRTALMYARSRHGRGIFDRAARQQAVLVGIRDRFLELGPARTLQAMPAMRKAVHTDLRTLDMIKLGKRLLAGRREHLHGLVLTPKHAEVTIRENGRWVMVPKPDEIGAALRDLFKAPPPGLRQSESCPDADVALKKK